MIRTHVAFDLENGHLDGDPAPGADIARRIGESLAARGLDCSSPEELDYAHELVVVTPEGRHVVMVGYVGDPDGRQWLAFVEPERRGLLPRSSADPSHVLAVLHEALTADLGARPQWFTEAEWNEPGFGRGHPDPTS